ncbi:hypothetical protein BO70DRAFT_64812 [Aspergillus heteromorphus CBS 117.55]|uniref:Uncharacterized protein n=1 Tax=Aspergillus heteromorphus CBS 117.55 TaxID=1448321 RepID=A0A317VWK4_9EURO|nr:uncharacterized protein BO70DRAFT_64812 [Aspergillus heteromorphus CBS 117.55]PWY77372.1 hypothetical protein BO70DRAFT_64812 [Aspergillus heteromorphus CBS 117.55]
MHASNLFRACTGYFVLEYSSTYISNYCIESAEYLEAKRGHSSNEQNRCKFQISDGFKGRTLYIQQCITCLIGRYFTPICLAFCTVFCQGDMAYADVSEIRSSAEYPYPGFIPRAKGTSGMVEGFHGRALVLSSGFFCRFLLRIETHWVCILGYWHGVINRRCILVGSVFHEL